MRFKYLYRSISFVGFAMDRIPLSPVNRPQISWSPRRLWVAGASAALLTGFASSPADSNHHIAPGLSTQVNKSSGVGATVRKPAVLSVAIPASGSVAIKQAAVPALEATNFNQRFEGPRDEDRKWDRALLFEVDGESDNNPSSLPGKAPDSATARRERTVQSPIGAHSLESPPASPVTDLDTSLNVDASGSTAQARPDLLSGIPTDFARLALAIAATDGVDPNWVLSVMRAENGGFDPGLVSSAGAIGLMQVMPRVGKAFGAKDLTDAEQNIQAGTRFLRFLIDKYRNPVLIAAAYNAGEPNVDLRHSLPLNRETADFVTRVVGYYTGTVVRQRHPQAIPPSAPVPISPRAGPAERVRSPMLVFSAAQPIPPDARPQREEGRRDVGGPVKIVKEEVSK